MDTRTLAPDAALRPDHGALVGAVRAVLEPVVRLALARGFRHAEMDDLLRQLYVDLAREMHRGVPPHRSISRLSVTTGLTRREVARRTLQAPPPPRPASVASTVFARWLADPALRDARGAPRRRLPRTGPAPSFQALVESISRDIKPRPHLDELVRLGLVVHDEATDTVELLEGRFVPSSDERQMLGFLGDNAGDHLRAAVANVERRAAPFLEQSVFADELSPDSVARLQPLAGAHWQALVHAVLPLLRELIAQDKAAGREANQRVRIGMYAFSAPMAAPLSSTHPSSDSGSTS